MLKCTQRDFHKLNEVIVEINKFSVKLQLCLFWVGSTQTEEYDEGDSSLFYQSDILPPNSGEALTEDCDGRDDEVCNDR